MSLPEIHYIETPIWEGNFWFIPQSDSETVKLDSVTEAMARAEAKEKYGQGIFLKQIEVFE
jgi:hypothetical protein